MFAFNIVLYQMLQQLRSFSIFHLFENLKAVYICLVTAFPLAEINTTTQEKHTSTSTC